MLYLVESSLAVLCVLSSLSKDTSLFLLKAHVKSVLVLLHGVTTNILSVLINTVIMQHILDGSIIKFYFGRHNLYTQIIARKRLFILAEKQQINVGMKFKTIRPTRQIYQV